MDPLADIASTAGVFGALFANGLVPLWVFAILLVRYGSLFVGSFILFLNYGPIRFRATPVGKIAGVVQAVIAIVILACAALRLPWEGMMGDMLLALLGVVFSSVIVSQVVIGIRCRAHSITSARLGRAQSITSARPGQAHSIGNARPGFRQAN
jgi:phosphatidylglycerophosphate synthase